MRRSKAAAKRPPYVERIKDDEIGLKAVILTGLLAFLLAAGCVSGARELTPAEINTLQPSGRIVNDVRVVSVTARRYRFSPDPIVVRSGENVRLEIISLDVPHGFSLAAYHIDVRIEPGKATHVTFIAGRQGAFPVPCSVYCGPGHTDMRTLLMVLPAARPY